MEASSLVAHIYMVVDIGGSLIGVISLENHDSLEGFIQKSVLFFLGYSQWVAKGTSMYDFFDGNLFMLRVSLGKGHVAFTIFRHLEL